MGRTGILAILIATFFVGNAAVAADKRPRDEVDEDLISRIGNRPFEAFLTEILAPIRNSADGKRLTRQEVEAADLIQEANRRASEIGRFLRYDLDGDGSVTAEEITQVTVGSSAGRPRPRDDDFRRGQAERTVNDLMRADDNGDGRVDFAEMTKQARLTAGRQADGTRADLRDLILELDGNDDGATTVPETEERARRVFGLYDRDGDGVIDDDARNEIAMMMRKSQERRRAEAAAARCVMPPAPAGDRIVYFAGGRSQAVSSIAVGGPDEVTMTAPVTVEPGDQHIYLVLSAPSDFLWRVEGAVERLDRVVLLQGGYLAQSLAAGVTGVDPSIVAFAEEKDCTRMAGTVDNAKGEATAAIFRRVLGRSFDDYARADRFSAVSVPTLALQGNGPQLRDQDDQSCMRALNMRPASAYPRAPQMGEPDCTWIEAEMRFVYPSGLVRIDPSKVVAHKVDAYEVLPSPFGYEQALKDGTLVDVSGGRRTRLRVAKPLVRFPPALAGPRPIAFDLAEGVALPAGAARQYCVRDSKGELVSGQPQRCPKLP